MEFLIGTGKSTIKCFKTDIGMMGYGMSSNTVHSSATDLFSRSIWIQDKTGNVFIYVCVEICFITPAIRREVLIKMHNELSVDFIDANVMISAQHTHSAPGGYSEYALYNFSIPGFQQEVFDSIVSGIFESVNLASLELKESNIDFVEGEVDKKMAWNRSLKAYNQNPENKFVSKENAHKAIDARMRMLRIIQDGEVCAQVNWFGVHATCIGKDNHHISSDNKGYAAAGFEKKGRKLGIFAQGLSGDVSPYYHGPGDLNKRKSNKGQLEHDFARINGEMQADEADKLFEMPPAEIIKGCIDGEIVNHDFAKIHVDKQFANGFENAKTGQACLGVAFFNGTRIDGRGLSNVLNTTAKLLSSVLKYYHYLSFPFKRKERQLIWKEKYRVQGKKKILMDAHEHRILGTTNIKRLIIPGFADPTVAEIKREHVNGAYHENNWMPHVLPLQIITIGKLAFVGCPGEYTITAGRRLERTILNVLKDAGIEHVIMCPFSNGYMGYVTTFEEYQLQGYEAGHTVFGQWTLGAFQTKFTELAQEMIKAKGDRKIDTTDSPAVFSEDELSKRTY
ncbi:neutral/alkaline non-lysosomal ceramidase N-terminal domain-containing protein [Flavobacteriales bacterium]|nr:neutral/alkaline non-lysosomal ceramidase N-terminal domain-containing protein [Flavobacteriales bacterium]